MTDQVLDLFHPAVQAWFRSAFAGPTPPQVAAWPAIKSGRHALVAAPTGSGKTLAAFLSAIDALVRAGVERGLPDETHVVYVSPLKALSNDIQQNLEAPLAGIRDALAALGLPDVAIRTLVRTGDTPQAERAEHAQAPAAHPGHDAGVALHPAHERVRPRDARDDAHRDRRRDPRARPRTSAARTSRCRSSGSRRSPGRTSSAIGLSATQKPIEEIARVPDRREPTRADCAIVDAGHVPRRDLAIELPPSPLEAVMSRRSVAAGLRPARRARQRAPHDARLRQHAAAGRARRATSLRAARRRIRSPRTTAAWRASGASTPSSG